MLSAVRLSEDEIGLIQDALREEVDRRSKRDADFLDRIIQSEAHLARFVAEESKKTVRIIEGRRTSVRSRTRVRAKQNPEYWRLLNMVLTDNERAVYYQWLRQKNISEIALLLGMPDDQVTHNLMVARNKAMSLRSLS